MTIFSRLGHARLVTAIVLAAALLLSVALTAQAGEDSSKKVSLEGGSTSLILDEGAAEALQSLDIGVQRVRPAETRPGGLRFPITGGKVDPETLAGRIRHAGGLALVRDETRVKLTRFTIKIDDRPNLTAKLGSDRVSILRLDLSNLKRQDRGDTVRLRGIEGRLTAGAAAALNEAFSTDAFERGLKVGNARVRAVVG
jgi:hypothetical protein